MIGQTISHYPAFRDLPLSGIPPLSGIRRSGTGKRDKVLEKLGEGGVVGNMYWRNNTIILNGMGLT